jgi:hypothetical protein
MKAICRHKLDQVSLTIDLDCCILDNWIQRGNTVIDIGRLTIAYDELSLSGERIK